MNENIEALLIFFDENICAFSATEKYRPGALDEKYMVSLSATTQTLTEAFTLVSRWLSPRNSVGTDREDVDGSTI